MKKNGFSLIELLVVVSIIGILSAVAIPRYENYRIMAKFAEIFSLASSVKQKVVDYQQAHGKFPADNNAAGLPPSDKLMGNYVQEIRVEDGALHFVLGNKINDFLVGKIVTYQPIVVVDSPASPMSWVCGFDQVPVGMTGVGENLTNVEREFLPSHCL